MILGRACFLVSNLGLEEVFRGIFEGERVGYLYIIL